MYNIVIDKYERKFKMATISAKHFDVLDFVKKSKEFGSSEQLAEYQARQMEQLVDFAINAAKDEIHSKELATKQDIREQLREQELRIIKWILGIGVVSVTTIIGTMFTMVKLIGH